MHHLPPSATMTGQPRILVVAFPGQGHLNPALRFATRLANMGVDVTFSTSLSAVRRIDKETTHHALTFSPFSDGHDNGMQPTTTMSQFVSDFAPKVSSAIAEIFTSAADAGRPFNHLVYTTLVPWAEPVANAHGIKSTVLWCQSATMLDIYYYSFNGYQDLIFSNNNNPAFPINFPGLPPLTVADLPSFLRPSPKEDDFALPVVKAHLDALTRCPRVLVNTFNELEIEFIKATEKIEFFPIGPLIPSEFFGGKGSNCEEMLQKSDDDSLKWLNTKPKSSVVYVSFGSIASLSMDQEEEIANGLLESRRPFLWVIRDSGKAERLSKIEELRTQGMIVDWCSQVEVLGHEAIGCFLSHGGWNSTTEALVAGVPMVVFPQWSDQATNGKMIEDVWKTGVRVKRKEKEDGRVEGREIDKCLERVMGDGEMGKNAEKWSKLAKEAVNNGGSSIINLQAFLDDA